MNNIISCTQISVIFFWMFGRTSPDRAWVPWGIDSFEKYTIFMFFTCNIMPCTQRYLLFSFGCSGEPVQSCVNSLKYRFLWKIQHIRVLYMHNIISYTHISVIFPLDFRANRPDRAWVPWSIDSFEKYTIFVYFTCNIISCTDRYILFSFGCSGEPVQSCVSSLEYRFLWKIQQIRVLYMHNIISYTHIFVISLWIFGRTGPTAREFPGV